MAFRSFKAQAFSTEVAGKQMRLYKCSYTNGRGSLVAKKDELLCAWKVYYFNNGVVLIFILEND